MKASSTGVRPEVVAAAVRLSETGRVPHVTGTARAASIDLRAIARKVRRATGNAPARHAIAKENVAARDRPARRESGSVRARRADRGRQEEAGSGRKVGTLAIGRVVIGRLAIGHALVGQAARRQALVPREAPPARRALHGRRVTAAIVLRGSGAKTSRRTT